MAKVEKEERKQYSELFPQPGESLDDWCARCAEERFKAQDDGWDGVESRIVRDGGLAITGYPPE